MRFFFEPLSLSSFLRYFIAPLSRVREATVLVITP